MTRTPASSRASSTRSPTSVDSSSIWASTSVAARPSPRRAAAARRAASTPSSRSRLVRSEVSGVRSSWPASATSRGWRSRDAASARSIVLNASVSRASSSVPSPGWVADRRCAATRSAAAVSRSTGRRPVRATGRPRSRPPPRRCRRRAAGPCRSLLSTWPGSAPRLLRDQQRLPFGRCTASTRWLVDGAQRHEQLARMTAFSGSPSGSVGPCWWPCRSSGPG